MLFDKQLLYQAQLLEHLPAAVIATNTEFTILFWNPEAEKIYGWRAEEVLGKDASEFIQPADTTVYSKAFTQNLQDKGFWNGYVQQQHKAGNPVYVETSIKCVSNDSGQWVGTVSVNKDISKQRQLENEMLLIQSRLAAIVRNFPVTISNQDTQLRYTYLHNVQHGFTAEESLGKTDEEALPVALSRQVIPIKKNILQTGIGEQHEVNFSHPTGDYSYLLAIEPLLNEQQEIIGLTTAAVNISSHKNIKTSLHEKESQLHHLTNSLPVLISYVDAWERYQFVNQNYEKWFDISKEYMLGKTLQEIAGDELYEKHKPHYKKALAGEKAEFVEKVMREGNEAFLHVQLLPFADSGKVRGFYVLAQDQTQLLSTQKALEENNQLYQAITRYFPKGNIFLLDSNYNITFAEGGGMRERGIPSEMFVGKHVSVFFSSQAQWEKHYAYFQKVLNGETVTFTDYVLEQHYEFTSTLLPDKEGNVYRILCIVRNITEQVQLQEEVKHYTDNLQEAQQLAKLGFWEYFAEENRMEWSEMIYHFFDLNPTEPIPGLEYFSQMMNVAVWKELLQEIDVARQQKAGFQFELGFKLPSGLIKYLQVNGKPLQTTRAGRIRRFGVAIDITEQHLLREKVKEQEARMQSLFESDTVGIIFWEINGKITHANNYFLRMLGYTREELEAGELNWKKLTPTEWKEKDQAALHSLLTDSTNVTKEKEYFHKNGSRIPIMMGSAFLAGYQDKGASFVLDVTELQKIRRELEQKAQELKYSNAELEKFAYVAAHDLQEPLNTLSGLINLLQLQADYSTDAELKKLLELIPGIIGRMQQLIKNLLEYSKIGSAKLHISAFEMEEVVKVVLASLDKRIKDTSSTIVYTDLPIIYADQPQITQLMQNLIGNAIKFRDIKPMRIEISGQNEPGGWRFSVRDTGIGMDMANATKIFGAFQRLHTRKEFEGTGLGLTICQKIVERHGGRIWVESELGVGSTFYFTLQKKKQGAYT